MCAVRVIFASLEPGRIPARGAWRFFGQCAFLGFFLILGVDVVLSAPGESGAEVSGTASSRVDLLFATNRAPATEDRSEEFFSGNRGQARFGRSAVEFVDIPVIKDIAPKVGFYLPRETSSIAVAESFDEPAFWQQVERFAAATTNGSIVVFVHGYNYGFDRTSRMAAEVQRMLRGDAAVLMFSWPSNGSAADYIPDQADVEWSFPFLAHVIGQLADRLGPERVSVLAHSLGSRGTVFALERLMAGGRQVPILDQLVFVAPDFDAQAFVDRLPQFAEAANAITVYASSNDRALQASRTLHQASRLGEGGDYLTVADGFQTIDVSGLGRYRFLGHQYFFFHPLVSADVSELLRTGRSAASRSGLRARKVGDLVFWEVVGVGTDAPGVEPGDNG
jgi:esterase/lipase superfamily enzyme